MTEQILAVLADELRRHGDTMNYRWGSEEVELGCTCGHERGTVTKTDLAAELSSHVRAYRLHVADALLAVLQAAGWAPR